MQRLLSVNNCLQLRNFSKSDVPKQAELSIEEMIKIINIKAQENKLPVQKVVLIPKLTKKEIETNIADLLATKP